MTETLHHEVSHQLLFESAGADRYDPKNGHFWVFEGLGTYFETLRPQTDGTLQIGGLVGKRIEVAQDRMIAQHEYIPIGRLASLQPAPVQRRDRRRHLPELRRVDGAGRLLHAGPRREVPRGLPRLRPRHLQGTPPGRRRQDPGGPPRRQVRRPRPATSSTTSSPGPRSVDARRPATADGSPTRRPPIRIRRAAAGAGRSGWAWPWPGSTCASRTQRGRRRRTRHPDPAPLDGDRPGRRALSRPVPVDPDGAAGLRDCPGP